MQFHDHPCPARRQPVDEVHLPQRSVAIERAGQHVGGDRFEVATVMDRAMVGRIDVDIDPIRLRVPQPGIGEASAQRRQQMETSTDQFADAPR